MNKEIIFRVRAIGRIAYKRAISTSALIERAAFDIIAADSPDVARAIAETAPDFFCIEGDAK